MPDEPLHATSFMLTRADALAYEQATGRQTPLGALALMAWLGLWGSAALLVPPGWAGPRLSWNFALLIVVLVAIGYVLALLGIALGQWRRARRRVRRPVEMILTEWADRLDIGGVGLSRNVGFGEVDRAILNGTHLFLESGADVLILPRRALREEGAIEALAARIEATPEAAPAEPPSVGQRLG